MATYDIFLSYRRKDTSSVQPFVDALRSRKVSVWFDQSEIDEFASITGEIRNGLANSKALLAWYSIDYPRSRPCQMELTAAFIAAQREGDPRKRVWVVNPESSPAHIKPNELRDEQHASAPKDPRQYDDLAGLVAQRVASLTGLLGGIIPLTPPPQYGQPLVSARHFVGRLANFWDIHSTLSGAKIAITSGESTSSLALLSGIGGVGKSLLAEEYALRFGAAYPGGIFWLGARGNDASRPGPTPEEQLALRDGHLRSFAIALDIAIRDLSAEEIHARLAIKLGNEKQPFLWIVDDLASDLGTDAVRGWLPPHPLGKAIFTTLSRAQYQELGRSVTLRGLAPEEAVELLCIYRKPDNPADRNAAEGIASDLGYHPLALAVCSRALEADVGLRNFVEFRAGLANSEEDELELATELDGVLPNGHEKSVAATLLRSIKGLGPEGQDFLRMAASLAAAPIPPSLVTMTFAGADGIKESAARRRAVLALSQVENASLAERAEGNGRMVHTLVSRTIRFHDRNDERRLQLRAALVGALNKSLPDVVDIRTHKRLELEVLHARELCAAGMDDADTATLGSRVARHDFERGAYSSARSLEERILAVRFRIFGEDHPRTLSSMTNLAVTLKEQGDLAIAHSLHKRILAVRCRNLGEDHPDTLISMNSIAETLMAQGDLSGAHSLHEQVLAVRLRILGEDHVDTFTSMNNLAVTLKAIGDLKGAHKLQEQTLATCRRIFGEEDPHTLAAMNNLAVTLKAIGDLKGAHKLQEQTLATGRRIFGEEHRKTLTMMNNFALTLRDQGDLNSARKLQEQVLTITHRIFGADHPETTCSRNNLAGTLRAQGDLSSARLLHEEVLAVSRRTLGEEHPLTLTAMNNLAMTLSDEGNFATARSLQERVLTTRRRFLGDENPGTLTAMDNLALTLTHEGDLSGAHSLFEQVLAVRLRILGDKHSDTSLTQWNLFALLLESGDERSALSIRKMLLWLLQEDPNTLSNIQRQIREQLLLLPNAPK